MQGWVPLQCLGKKMQGWGTTAVLYAQHNTAQYWQAWPLQSKWSNGASALCFMERPLCYNAALDTLEVAGLA